QREWYRVLEVREVMDTQRGYGMVERPPQLDREGVGRLLVEAELADGPRFVPARIVVIPRGIVEAELHVVVRPDPVGGVDHAPLEGGEDRGGRGEDGGASRPGDDLVAEARADAHLEPLVVADRVDLLPEPSGHLRGERRALARHEVEGGVGLLPELEPVTLEVPGRHAL